ncbi:MAG: hypothetical protein J7494_12930 [Sphingobium sp.]|nr:hypothetical protein [Sphingobium sp.]
MKPALLIGAIALIAGAGPALAQGKPGATSASRQKAFAKLPNWTGYWLTENDETSIGGLGERSVQAKATGTAASARPVMSLYGFAAPWNEEGKKRQAEARAKSARGAQGWGYPIMMNAAAPIQFIVTPEEVLIINAYRDVRHIYTDGRKLPSLDDSWPTVWGESVGHWEGDTLVVETIQVKNPNYYFHGSPPLSEEARYVERIRRVGNRITDEFTITDPTTLTGPWKATVTYQPAEGFDRMISIEFDNDRTDYGAGTGGIRPPADEK